MAVNLTDPERASSAQGRVASRMGSPLPPPCPPSRAPVSSRSGRPQRRGRLAPQQRVLRALDPVGHTRTEHQRSTLWTLDCRIRIRLAVRLHQQRCGPISRLESRDLPMSPACLPATHPPPPSRQHTPDSNPPSSVSGSVDTRSSPAQPRLAHEQRRRLWYYPRPANLNAGGNPGSPPPLPGNLLVPSGNWGRLGERGASWVDRTGRPGDLGTWGTSSGVTTRRSPTARGADASI